MTRAAQPDLAKVVPSSAAGDEAAFGRIVTAYHDDMVRVFTSADGVPVLEGIQTWESDLSVDSESGLWIGGSRHEGGLEADSSDPPHGVLSFDGETWQHYLSELSIERVEAMDGVVWAADIDHRDGQGGLYVINPRTQEAAD